MSTAPSSLIVRGVDAGGRPCVFKRLHPENSAREDYALRLQNECAVLTTLRGVPGIIQLLDVIADPLTLVLELADGGSLADRLANGPVSGPEAARLATELVAAVAACHRLGVIHRDIKPSNLLIAGGSLRLADFGVAASGDPPRALPAGWDEDAVGTPPWSAPEMRQHATGRTSFAVDVYGVARVLDWILGQPRPPSLSAAIAAALNDEPDGRPSIEELGRILERSAQS